MCCVVFCSVFPRLISPMRTFCHMFRTIHNFLLANYLCSNGLILKQSVDYYATVSALHPLLLFSFCVVLNLSFVFDSLDIV